MTMQLYDARRRPRFALRIAAPLVLFGFGLSLLTNALQAQSKKPEAKSQPSVRMTVPLGVSPGIPTKVTIRGTKLDTATAIRFPGSQATAKIIAKGPAPLSNNKNAAKEGATQVTIEVALPAACPRGTVSFVVVTPAGETAPHTLLVAPKAEVLREKEPNNGFRQAQTIRFPAAIDGTIDPPKDVDVFRFEGRAGQRVRFEVLAARYGSALDSVLTLYDAAGHEIATADDQGDNRDSLLEATLPRAGVYYLSLVDAHDQGGKAFPYRLTGQIK